MYPQTPLALWRRNADVEKMEDQDAGGQVVAVAVGMGEGEDMGGREEEVVC